MIFRLTVVLTFLFGINNTSNAQGKLDLGIIYGANSLYRMNFEFRKSISDDYKIKIGGIIGSEYTSIFNSTGKIILAEDSLIIERFRVENEFQFTINIGVEKRLKESMFSIGGDLLLGYLSLKEGFYNVDKELTTDNDWVTKHTVYSDHIYDDPTRSLRQTNYFNTGLRFKFSMDIPIEESFLIHLYVGQIISTPIYLSETILKDPSNEFQAPKDAFTVNSTSEAGIGLRYIFN